MNPYDKHAQFTDHWLYTSHGPTRIIDYSRYNTVDWSLVFVILGSIIGTLAYILIGGMK